MSSYKIVQLLEAELDAVLNTLSEKYGPMLVADFNALWIHGDKMKPVVQKSEAHQLFAENLVEAQKEEKPVEKGGRGKDAGRARVVSKKMQESFLALATSNGKSAEEATALFEQAKKQYKEMSQAELDTLGGSFDSFSKSVLGIQEQKKEKKEKPKKEKAPSRIDRWTPTLTRTLTKIVEESGGQMTDDRKKEFHAWVDQLSAEEFASCAMEGQMRKWILTLRPVEDKASDPAPSEARGGSGGAASGPPEDDEEEDLEELTFEGETLMIGTKTGKIFRPSGSGDIWVGNAGVGRFTDIQKP